MTATSFYRGGNSLKPKFREVKIDPITGLVQTQRGVSVFNRPDNLDRFGESFRLTNVPESLRIVQQGRDPAHHEIVPVAPMTMDEYEEALNSIVLYGRVQLCYTNPKRKRGPSLALRVGAAESRTPI